MSGKFLRLTKLSTSVSHHTFSQLSSRIKQGTKMPLHVRDFKLRLQQESKKFTLIGDFPSLLSSNVLPLPQPCGRRQLSTVCGEEDVHAGKLFTF